MASQNLRPLLGGSFGVMQGRLSQQGSVYQSCPISSWEREFDSARALGFDHIEWVVDLGTFDQNPLLTEPRRVAQISQESSVRILTLTADFLRDRSLSVEGEQGWPEVTELLRCMQVVGIKVMTVPFVEQASLFNPDQRVAALPVLSRLGEIARSFDIGVSIETDLPPSEVVEFNDLLGNNRVGVTYDCGDGASMGYSAEEEIRILQNDFRVVHIKDRTLGGNSVPLGEGKADLRAVITFLLSSEYSGPVTLQAFRDQHGQKILESQLSFLRNLVAEINLSHA